MYQALFESIDDGVCVVEVLFDHRGDPIDYRFLQTNPAFEKQTGLSRGVGKTARELTPDLEARWPAIIGRVATTGDAARFEARWEALDRWFDVFATRVGDPAAHHVAVVLTNITDRRQQLATLESREARYRQLADSLPELVWTALPDGRLDYVNRRWLEYTGVPLEEAGARGWESCVDADDAPQVKAAWAEARLSGTPFEQKLRYRRSTGDSRWHLVRGVPEKNEAGRIAKWFGTTIDVHDGEVVQRDNGFLSNLSERLRLALDPEQLLEEVPSAVGPYLGLSRCCFAALSDTGDRWSVRHDYSRGLGSLAGEYPLSLYDGAMLTELRTGRTHAIDDVLSDPRTAPLYEQVFQPFGIRAQALVPVLREGRWSSSLIAASDTPHLWQDRERLLLEAVAARTWNAVEKLRADTALRRSEAIYRSVVELAPDGIYLAEQGGAFIDVNPAGAAMLGYTRDEFVELSVADMIRPEDAPRLEELRRALTAGQHATGEWEVRHKDGRYIPIELSQRFTPDGRWQAIGRDVSERRRTEARNQFLLQLQDAIRKVTDPSAIMAAATALLGRHLGVARCAYADVDPDGVHFTIPYEHPAAQIGPTLVGQWTLNSFGPQVAGELRAGHTLVVRDYRLEMPADAAAFAALHVRATICATTIRDGRLTAMMAVHESRPRDWTADEIGLVQAVADRCWDSIERARALRDLQASEMRFRALIDQATVGIARLDLTGAFTLVNPRWCQMVGYTEAELIGGMRIQDLVHPDDLGRSLELLGALMDGGADFTIEKRYIRKDGGEVWVSNSVTGVRAPDGNLYGLMTVTIDITGRKQVEADLRAASRMKDEFLATLSHELRTPLNAVLGWTHMIRTGTLRKEVEARAFDSLERNARAQAQLVDDLLDVSRIISGRMQIASDDVDLAGVITAAIETVQPAALAKRVALVVDLDAEEAVFVSGDADRLRQIVWNLLSNAVKFTPPGGRVTIALTREAADAVIAVSDTGPGIGPEFLPFLFERFRQADSTTTRRHGGLGLGLAIVRHLAEAHGGTVSAVSGIEGGATLTVRLPIHVTAPAAALTAVARAAEDTSLQGIAVLLAADDGDAGDLLQALLESHGAMVTPVGIQATVVEALEREPFGLLVIDVEDDGIGAGLTLIRAVRASEQAGRIPAIFVTADATTRDRQQSQRAGFDLHYAEPLDPDRFVRGAGSLIRSRLA